MTRVVLQNARNVRDLGGIVASDGRAVAAGRLLRGDALNRVTDADVATLDRLGLRTVIDFRTPEEIAATGADRLPPDTTLVALPIAAGSLAAVVTGAAREQSLAGLLGNGDGSELMTDINRRFVADPELRSAFAAALRIAADPDRHPVLFHCTAGKDRTGWMAALVLTAVGAPREAVVADYLATNDYVGAAYADWTDRLVAAGAISDAALLRPLLHQEPEYLDAAFAEIDSRYGDFDRFLTEGMNFGPADAARLRTAVLT